MSDFKSQKDQEVGCEAMSPSDVRCCTHEVSLAWLPKCYLNNDDTKGHAKQEEKPMRPQPKKAIGY